MTGKAMRKACVFHFQNFVFYVGIVISSFCEANQDNYDLTVVSSIDFNGSVRRHAIGLIECLNDKLKINFIPSRPINLDGVNPLVQEVVLSAVKTPGNVALLEDPLWYADVMPCESKIKIAFSVFESTRIPKEWVDILNTKFDAVVVADHFFVKVYEDSGVTIPIFHIPLGIYIDEFLETPLKTQSNELFVFRCNARFFFRKNHDLLIRAFACEFGNREDVCLQINGGGKWGNSNLYKKCLSQVKKLGIKNVYITNDALSWNDYIKTMSATDCYINISQGEGFSITPRESLALGIPTIITDNTAQKSICASGFVRSVPSELTRPVFRSQSLGNRFDCRIEDVQEALRDVYNNYQLYLAKAHAGREWVKQFRWSDLQGKYLSLIKPETILLGDRNEITADYLMTNSKILYEKYIDLRNQ